MAHQYDYIQQAKLRAMRDFNSIPGIQGYGIGDGVLRIYCRAQETMQMLPATYLDVPIECIITGEIRPL